MDARVAPGLVVLASVALAGGALWLASSRGATDHAEAVGTCPPQEPTPLAVAAPEQFFVPLPPHTVLYQVESDAQAFATVQLRWVDIAAVTMPPSVADLASKYEWQLAQGLFAVTYDKTATTRVNNTKQVIADDWINYMRSSAGVALLQALGYVPIAAAAVPPIPDWDIDLNGTTSLGDIGQVVANWGQASDCNGWIRPDVNNDGKVSLGDIGEVAQHWGNEGLICDDAHDHCDNPGKGWWSVPGVAGIYQDWGGGNPDHHDGGATEHAVDIAENGIANVYYYDPRGDVTSYARYIAQGGCGSSLQGGDRLEIDVYAGGVKRATAVYRHLQDVPLPLRTPDAAMHNGDPIGDVYRGPFPGTPCSTGEHLHQGVIDQATPAATPQHYTGPQPGLTPGTDWFCIAGTPSDPSSTDGWPNHPCYGVNWR